MRNIDQNGNNVLHVYFVQKIFSTIFYRHVVFCPTVPIKLDYQGKHLDMAQGALSGIIMGLTQLNGSQLQLKRLDYKRGILGLQKLIDYCLKEWTNDIKQTQVPNLLKGIGPMNAIFNLSECFFLCLLLLLCDEFVFGLQYKV